MTLANGTHLGPYEILDPIGAGGMGVVYRAKDTRLGRAVAIKVLPPAFSVDADRLRRFELEARTVSALNHPNIITVHALGNHEGSPYLVMELLEGQTLREKMGGNPVPPSRALEIGLELARGLTAAHERGIVHRDLKPENVFLTKDGRVKILDFGLAKLKGGTSVVPGLASGDNETQALGSDETFTEAGMVLGTVAYMSPEQACGQPLDGRSDIFSLGVILWEMLTGKRPFQRDSVAETLSAILKVDPPELDPDLKVAPLLERVLRTSLSKAPEGRFHSAHDLAFALQAASESGQAARVPSGEILPTVSLPPSARSRWRRLLPLSGLAALLLLVVVWSPWRAKALPYDPRCVAILPLENRTGDPALESLGQQVVDLVRQDLQPLDELKVAADQQLPNGGGSLERRLAGATMAHYVVAGAYYLRAGQVEIQARLVDPWTGHVIYQLGSWKAPREDLNQALPELRQRIGGVVAWTYNQVMPYAPGAVRPPRLDAVLIYLKLMKEWMARPASDQVLEFEKAVALDPDFFPVRQDFFDTLMMLGRTELAAEQVQAMEARHLGSTTVERMLIRMTRSELEGWSLETLKALEDLNVLMPDLPWLQLRLAGHYLKWRRPGPAIPILLGIPSDWSGKETASRWLPSSMLCTAFHMKQDYRNELNAARAAQKDFPTILDFRAREAEALVGLGRAEEAEQLAEALSTTPLGSSGGSPRAVQVTTMLELRAHGHLERAVRVAAKVREEVQGGAPEHRKAGRLDLAQACLCQNRLEEALAIYRELAAEDKEAVYLQGCMGSLLARLGRGEESRKIANGLAGLKRPPPWQHTYWCACIAANLGDKLKAVELLRKALAQGGDLGWRTDCDLFLEPLRGYPPFDELMKAKD